MATDWTGKWDGQWEGSWFGADTAEAVSFTVSESPLAPRQGIVVVSELMNRATGAAGNFQGKDAFQKQKSVTKEADKYTPRLVVHKRIIKETVPPPTQKLVMGHSITRDTISASNAPIPKQGIKASISLHGKRSREEDELLLLLFEVA